MTPILNHIPEKFFYLSSQAIESFFLQIPVSDKRGRIYDFFVKGRRIFKKWFSPESV